MVGFVFSTLCLNVHVCIGYTHQYHTSNMPSDRHAFSLCSLKLGQKYLVITGVHTYYFWAAFEKTRATLIILMH